MHYLCHILAMLTVMIGCLAGLVYAKGKGGGGGGGRGSKGFSGKQSFGGKGGGKSSAPVSRFSGSKQQLAKGPAGGKLAKNRSPALRQSSDGELAENKKYKQLQLFEQQRDKRLSQADHLRQIAERNGNANLAANADRMEAQALQQYADKADRLEKFGIIDPTLDQELPPLSDDGVKLTDGSP